MNITEGDNRQICFSTDIGSDVSYEVQVDVHPKGSSPAIRGQYNLPISCRKKGEILSVEKLSIKDLYA